MNLPSWSLKKATPADRETSHSAYKNGSAKTIFHDRGALKRWMDYQGWRSWLFPEDSFYKALFENNRNFDLALKNVIDIYIPKSTHHISDQALQELDQDYEARSWSAVVAGLRDIRRAIEAGVIIDVDGKTLKAVGAYYTWAHKRYHLLEEMSDKWIGDDR